MKRISIIHDQFGTERWLSWLVLLLSALALALAVATSSAVAKVRPVTLTGQPAPGTPNGIRYNYFGIPRLNDAGQTAFYAVVTGSGVDETNKEGIWSEGSGNLNLVARAGSHAPGTTSGINFDRFVQGVSLSDGGQTVFEADVVGDGVDFTNDRGIWSERSGGLNLVARTGSQAPGTPSGARFRELLGSIVVNSVGEVAFRANLTGSGVDSTNGQGIWSEGSGNLAMVARTGDQAPGTPSSIDFGSFAPYVRLNDPGQIAFVADLTGDGRDRTHSEGIWSESSGDLELVAGRGDPAPDTPNGVNYSSIERMPSLNNAGQVAFVGILTGTGVDETNNKGIWSGDAGNLILVARTGSQAPGVPGGIYFEEIYADLLHPPVLNAAGQTAFVADLVGSGVDSTNNRGIWSEGSGHLNLVARAGSHAPGTPSGVHFSSFLVSPALNGSGQIAFFARMNGSGIDLSNDEGIWATDVAGRLQLIVRVGNPLEVAPLEFRTIDDLAFGGFNDRGQIAFFALFTDGTSGVFVSNRVAVPETNMFVLAGFATIVVFGFAVRRKRLTAHSVMRGAIYGPSNRPQISGSN